MHLRAGLSARERNQLKRKLKRQASAAAAEPVGSAASVKRAKTIADVVRHLASCPHHHLAQLALNNVTGRQST